MNSIMDKRIAKELVAIADLIIADDAGWIRKSIQRFIDVNAEEMGEYDATMQIRGPKESTKWMNVSIDNLKRIMKAVR